MTCFTCIPFGPVILYPSPVKPSFVEFFCKRKLGCNPNIPFGSLRAPNPFNYIEITFQTSSSRWCVCVFRPPVKSELLLDMIYQSLVFTSMMSPPYPRSW